MSFSEDKIIERTVDFQTECTIKQAKLFDLQPIENKRVEVCFAASDISSHGGLLLIKDIEARTGIIKALANCIEGARHQGYVDHPLEEIAARRVYQIVAGYEDANDCNTLRDDTILKMSVGRGRRSTLFNNYYGEYCYMPLHIYEGLSGKLIATILKPGRRSKSANVYGILKRRITHLRTSWKDTVSIVRGDSHFCSKQLMDRSVDQPKVRFITGQAANIQARYSFRDNTDYFGLTDKKVKEY